MTDTVRAFAATSATTPLALHSIPRRHPKETDVQFEILFCGVCHSDIHASRDEWKGAKYPMVPGHELVGKVTKVGAKVTKHKVGDLVGVGCMVDSDRSCPACKDTYENLCSKTVYTYNSPDPHLPGHSTYGGYSESVTVDQDFVLKMPTNLDLAKCAPLLCAGVTTYAPMRRFGVTKGKKIGVNGLGGLGHMAVKFARAFGAFTVLYTTSPSKIEDGKRLGADDVIISKDPEQMKKYLGELDFIIDTVSADHDMNAFFGQLKYHGTLCLVGLPENPMSIRAFSLVAGQKTFVGSSIGSIAETQDMLDFCGAHGITSEIEMINIQEINEAYARMIKADVKYRFVIDLKSLKQ